ncbi:MAG: P-II family nitrogen regulator [Clostridiales Family XIII bacterium]|jgi:nitrogen regulatory protein PII|nr:P-II family nitrogen regulator [Clostridiales Family XIII bacterium]
MTEPNETAVSLIVTIVSKGYADIVIAAAKEAGARGGTVRYARGSGIHETERFLNFSIEPEKEIVLTMVKSAAAREIVTAIVDKAGLTKAGAGISFVLPVTRVAGVNTDAAEKAQSEKEAEAAAEREEA